jgi:hypothetical protein
MSEKKKIVLTRRVVDPGPQLNLEVVKKKLNIRRKEAQKKEPEKKKLIIKTRGVFRLNLEVEFDHIVRGPKPIKVSFSIRAYVPQNEVQTQDLIEEAFERWRISASTYLKNATGRYNVISFERLDLNTAYNFNFIPMNSKTAMMNSLYNQTFDSLTPEQKEHEKCVINHLLHISKEQAKKKGYSHLTRIKLQADFKEVCGIDIEKDPITPANLLDWHREKHSSCCRMYILDGFLGIQHKVGTKKDQGLCIELICTNQHCIGITGSKKKVSNTSEKFVKIEIQRNADKKILSSHNLSPDTRKSIISGDYFEDYDLIFEYDVDKTEEITFLEQLFLDIVKHTKVYPFNIQLDSSKKPKSFFHPVSKQHISISSNVACRRNVCQILYSRHPVYQFEFRDQSWAHIGADIFLDEFGESVTMSNYTLKTQYMYKKFCTSPLTCGVTKIHHEDGIQTPDYKMLDVAGCYPNTLLDLPDWGTIPVFDAMETFEPFNGRVIKDNAFYLIDKVDFIGGVWDKPQCVPSMYVKFLLRKGYLKWDQIKNEHVAKNGIRMSLLKDFAFRVVELFPHSSQEIQIRQIREKSKDDKEFFKLMRQFRAENLKNGRIGIEFSKEARSIIINWIGKNGMTMQKDFRSCVTSDENEVKALINLYDNDKIDATSPLAFQNHVEFRDAKIGNQFILDLRLETLKTSDNAPIMRMIHAMAKTHLINMLEAVYDPERSIIESVRTDSISGLHLRSVPDPRYRLKEGVPVEPKPYIPVELPVIESLPPWIQLDDLHFDQKEYMRVNGVRVSLEEGTLKLQSLIGKSFFMTGPGGNQKSEVTAWLIQEYFRQGKKFEYLTTSKKALDPMRKKLKDAPELLDHLTVLSSYFHPQKQIGDNSVPDVLFVDECSQCGAYWRKIHKMKERGAILVLIGDYDQIPPVSGDDEIEELHDRTGLNTAFYDMPSRRFFRDLCDNQMMEKKWYDGICRNDDKLKEAIDWTRENKTLHPMFNDPKFAINSSFNVNMSYLRKTKQDLNDKYLEEMQQKGLIGMSLTGIDNKGKIVNGRRYKLLEILEIQGETMYKVKADGLDEVQIASYKSFEPGHCDTIHRYQGDKVDENYNIHDLDHPNFNFNLLMVALGRATKLEYIHLTYTKKVFQPEQETDKVSIVRINPAKVGEIYRMSYPDQEVEYIGMTQTTKEDREKTHLEYNDNPIKKYGTNYKLEHVAWTLFMRVKDLKWVESSYIAKSIQYSPFENVNVDQTSKAKQKRTAKTTMIEIPIENNPIQMIEVKDGNEVPIVVLRHKKNGNYFRMVCSIKKLPRATLSKKFGNEDGRIMKSFKSLNSDALLAVDQIILEQAKLYLKNEGITRFEIVRENYNLTFLPVDERTAKSSAQMRLKIERPSHL